MPIRARYDRATKRLMLPGGTTQVQFGADGNLHARVEEVRDVSLLSLMRAASSAAADVAEDVLHLYLQDLAPQHFWPGDGPQLPVHLSVFHGRVQMAVWSDYVGEQPPLRFLGGVAGPLAQRHRLRVVGSSYGSAFGQDHLDLRLEPLTLQRRTVGDLLDAGEELHALLTAVLRRGRLDARACAELVRAKQATLLIGQRETATFEAKRGPPRTEVDRDRFELAKDVAALLNGGAEAVLIFGLRTRGGTAGDVVISADGIGTVEAGTASVRSVIDTMIFPRPQGVEVEAVAAGQGDRGWLLVWLPTQPPELLPFFVRRLLRQGGTNEWQFSLPTREGETTGWWDISRVHGLIAAGRAALEAGASTSQRRDSVDDSPR